MYSRPTSVGRLGRPVAVALVLAIAVAGCSAKKGPTASTSVAGAGNGKEFIIDLNGPLSDPYFGPMKQGADAAAKAFGISYQYSTTRDESNFVADYSPLIQAAIARRPAAIVLGNFVPSAFDPMIKRAVAAGIPVVEVDTGADTYRDNGAVGFVGVDRSADGAASGQAAVKAGVRNLVCVNHAPVNPTLHQTCEGAKAEMTSAGGVMTEMNIPIADSSNPSIVTQDIQAYLRSHPDVDGILTLGSAIATDAVTAVKALGKDGKIKIGTNGNSTAQMKAVKAGKLSWIVDAQQYLQGFYSLQIAVQYIRYGMRPSQPVYTGGLVITKDNVDQALAVQQRHKGIRGAA